ncbi:MAG: hypothetical protein HY673_14880 [Chloroflexi bacterium]|nr:hypothetical protein [Chloroflexota bacterium]
MPLNEYEFELIYFQADYFTTGKAHPDPDFPIPINRGARQGFGRPQKERILIFMVDQPEVPYVA